MSSMIHGIRILSKKGAILRFKTFLIYSDWDSLPRTHGFPLLFLSDYTDYWEDGETAFEKDLLETGKDLYQDINHAILSQRYIKKMIVSEFQNLPIKPEFLEYTWHYIEKETDKFHFEEHLPQAIYELEVTDPKWIEHIPVGAVWETTACDLIGPYWYLETPEKNGKFYRIYRSMNGGWIINYGKIGMKGRVDKLKFMTIYGASQKVKEKVKKGYKLIYQNFDTDWDIEEKLKRDAEELRKKKEIHIDSEKIFKAIQKQDVKKIEKILNDNIDPNKIKDKWGYYALERASDAYKASENSYKIVEILLKKGANPNLGNYGPFFPSICYANWNNPWQEKIIELLLDNGVDITLIGGLDKHSVLQTATVSGRKELLKKCIKAGLDVMHRSSQGHTALHYAAYNKKDSIEIIDILLNSGADINDNNGTWGTPLHFAAERGTKEIVLYLLKKGAKVNIENSKGESPIHLASQYGNAEILEILLRSGANPNIITKEGLEPIDLIFKNLLNKDSFKKIKFLSKYLDISKQSGSKLSNHLLNGTKRKTKLTKKEEKILIEVIKLGYNPYWQNSKGGNLLHFATKVGNLNLTKFCLEYENISINLQDEYGWTAFHYAKASKNKEIISLLLTSKDLNQNLASKKQRKIFKEKYPKGTTAKSI